MRKSYTFGNNLKVNLRQIARKWQTGILHTFLAVFLMAVVACDFDIPEKFEMPVWYLDLKIPLVNSKYEMTDISNPDIGIFPTPDSMVLASHSEIIGFSSSYVFRGCEKH